MPSEDIRDAPKHRAPWGHQRVGLSVQLHPSPSLNTPPMLWPVIIKHLYTLWQRGCTQ